MSENATPQNPLDAAKERLRHALARLENATEKKLKNLQDQLANAATGGEGASQEQMDMFANENKKLREENEKLQQLHTRVTKKVDRLIEDVKQVVGK
jgi:exonuclease VII large subunit